MTQIKRKILYIDHLFQKNMILLFIAINMVMVLSNLMYYWLTMNESAPADLKNTGIVIANFSEILFDNILSFNLVLAVILCVLIILFYFHVHRKLNLFFTSITDALRVRKSSSRARAEFLVSSEFQGIDEVLHQFFKQTDEELRAGDNLIENMRKKAENFSD